MLSSRYNTDIVILNAYSESEQLQIPQSLDMFWEDAEDVISLTVKLLATGRSGRGGVIAFNTN